MEIERKKLYETINKRAEKMFNNGWRQEVQDLIEKYGNSIMETNALKALGYNEVFNSIIENRETNLEIIKQKTRNYAKRQETWIRNKFKINFKFHSYDEYNNLLNECKKFLKNINND